MVKSDPYRMKELDYDARCKPKTDRSCVKCQRDIKLSSQVRYVHVIDGGTYVLHPEDEEKYMAAGLAGGPSDCGAFLIGMDCARMLGLEWTSK